MNKPSVAVAPLYETAAPNDTILLYEGQIEFSQGDWWGRDGRLSFEWLPTPHLEFELEIPTAIPIEIGPILLTLTQTALQLDGGVESIQARPSGKKLIRGWATTRGWPADHPFLEIRLHVVNFPAYLGEPISRGDQPWLGRMVLGQSDWDIVVDSLEYAAALRAHLRRSGGFAITNCMRIRRPSGTTFTVAEAGRQIQLALALLGFIQGAPTPPLLAVGIDEGGEEWPEWPKSRVHPWMPRSSWFVLEAAAGARDMYGSLRDLADTNDDLCAAIQHLVGFYCEANCQTVPGAKLAMAVTGLERLAAILRDIGVLPSAVSALGDALRLMTDWADLPLAIPPQFEQLAELASGRDGRAVVVDIRNAVTHELGRGTSRLRLSDLHESQIDDAGELSLMYLELAILRLLRYEGPRCARCPSA